jgi:hypothetical protein
MSTHLSGPPPIWDELDPQPPLFASRGWLDCMGSRLEGEHRWFVEAASTPQAVGLFGSLVADAAVSESKNPWGLLFEPCPAARELTDDAVSRLESIRSGGPARADWFPAMVVTFPGLECFAIGAGRNLDSPLDRVIAQVLTSASEEGARTVAFLYVQPEDDALAAALQRAGLVQAPIATRANLRLPGTTFEDYLASLSRNGRHSVAGDRRHLARHGVQVRQCPLPAADDATIDELVRLRAQHRSKYGKRPDDDGERDRLASFQQLGTKVTLFLAEVDGRVIGFSLLLDAGAVHHLWMTGTDYEDSRSRNTYFEVMYHAPIEYGYEAGISEISFSYGTELPKVRRGCRIDPVYAYLRPPADSLTATRQAAEVLRSGMTFIP